MHFWHRTHLILCSECLHILRVSLFHIFNLLAIVHVLEPQLVFILRPQLTYLVLVLAQL